MSAKPETQGEREAFQAEFDKLGYQWSESNQEKAFLGWKLARAADGKTGGEARMRAALDAIYNESDECRAAVIKHYGVNHYFDTRPQPAAQVAQPLTHVGYFNKKYGIFFRLGELAASERKAELLATGEIVQVFAQGIGKDQSS